MTLQEQIKADMISAMKAKNPTATTALKSMLSAFTNELVNLKRTPQDKLTDEEAIVVIKRGIKQRKDSVAQYESAGRPELAETEKVEIEVLEKYLPASMSKDEIKKVAVAKKEELGVTDKAGMGKLIGIVMKELQGKADGGDVKEVVESLF
ncbi:MAG: GatB/YqeY domain-containing protein [Candidatus Paceibacterota bacterium]